ncbi:MAG: TIGR01244 family sulfur transferase [Congregibacter sp.]
MNDAVRYVQLNSHVAASPQIQPEHMAAIAQAGFKVVVNNRPDGEAPDQPDSEALRHAAEAAGMRYHYYPINAFNYPGEDLAFLKTLFEDADQPVFAFCRSGTRSSNLWVSTRDSNAIEDARSHIQALGFDPSMSLSTA